MESVLAVMKAFRNEGIYFKRSRLCFGVIASTVSVTPVSLHIDGVYTDSSPVLRLLLFFKLIICFIVENYACLIILPFFDVLLP